MEERITCFRLAGHLMVIAIFFFHTKILVVPVPKFEEKTMDCGSCFALKMVHLENRKIS